MKALGAVVAMAGCAWGQVKLPPYSREALPNGAVIAMLPRSGVPLVHFRVLIKGGVESDPAQMAGLAGITANLLRRGTATRSASQFADELDSLGGTFAAGADSPLGSATAISAEFLAKDFDRGLDLIADAILRPAFTDTEVQKELARSADAARAAKDNPQAAIGSYLRAAFFGSAHPYGHPPDEAAYGRMQRKDIAEYHQKIYCGRNMLIVAAGEFDAAAAKAKLAAAFGAAPAGTAYTWAAAPAVARKGQVVLIDKPDATQTYFEIAQPGIDRKSPDRTVLELVNTLFGGRFTSMLNDELRVNSGLTYGAGSRMIQPRVPGMISISTYTRTDTTVKAIDLALEVLGRFEQRGVTAEQLASAKAYVKGLYPRRALETMDQMAESVGEIELYGLGREEVDGLFARIDAVTPEQANAAIRKYYRREDLTFVFLGPAAKIRDGVKKYGSKVREISIQDSGWGG